MKACFPRRSIPLFAFILALGFSSEPAFAICGSDKVIKATSDPTDCLPARVCDVLRKLADKFGQVQVVSGYRPRDCREFHARYPNLRCDVRQTNAVRGGVKGSQHLNCRAADILVPNRGADTVQAKLKAFLQWLKGGGGMRYNVYCTGRTHVDNSNLHDNYSTCPNGASPKTGQYKRKRKSRRGRW